MRNLIYILICMYLKGNLITFLIILFCILTKVFVRVFFTTIFSVLFQHLIWILCFIMPAFLYWASTCTLYISAMIPIVCFSVNSLFSVENRVIVWILIYKILSSDYCLWWVGCSINLNFEENFCVANILAVLWSQLIQHFWKAISFNWW